MSERSEYRKPVCCRCNGSGRYINCSCTNCSCTNCSCTKSVRPCVNCLPLHKGLCRNQDASNTLSPVPAPSALDGIPPLPSNPDNLADTPPSTQLYVPSASSDPDDAIVDEAIFVDADGWRRICVSIHGASNDLCEALTSLARRLCTDYVDPTGIETLVTCRLIPLDKGPGVRPIGIGETPRQIMAKAIMSVLRPDILEVAGSLQLCAGQEAGCEAQFTQCAQSSPPTTVMQFYL